MNKPNILFLMLDQLHYRDLGYMGHPVVKTPHLDQLRADAVHFTNCYVQNAFCLPSRVSYLSGQYLFHHRQYGFTGLLDECTPSMPRHFRNNGYKTFHVGKLHVNPYGENIGFDTLIPTLPEDICQSTDMRRNFQVYCQEKGLGYPTDQVHGDDYRFPGMSDEICHFVGTSRIPSDVSQETYTADQAIDFISGTHDKSFFAHASFDRPHGPWTPSPEYAELYPWQDIPLPPELTPDELESMPEHIRSIIENSDFSVTRAGKEKIQKILSCYYALITQIDDQIGRIVKALHENKLYEDTAIVFCADHGDMAGHKGLFDKHSNRVYHDDIIRTPLLLKLPQQQSKGSEVKRLTESIDIFPTLCDICKVPTADLPLDGISLMQLVNNEETTEWRTMAFSESYALKTVIQDNKKLIYYVNSDEGEFYDLAADPREYVNRYNDVACQDTIREMKLAIIRHMTGHVSEKRQAYIRSLFDESNTRPIAAMGKLFKWDKGIVEGGGFWMLLRDSYRLTYIPFDDTMRFEERPAGPPVDGIHWDYTPANDPQATHACLDELINYIATKIRPISLMTGSAHERDNMTQTKGHGLC